MIMLDATILETLKIAGHFLIPLILMITFRQCRVPVLVALLLSISLVSAKEIIDLSYVSHIEYDDLSMNALGAFIGALV